MSVIVLQERIIAIRSRLDADGFENATGEAIIYWKESRLGDKKGIFDRYEGGEGDGGKDNLVFGIHDSC